MILALHSPGLIDRIAGILSGGGVAIMPCDTIYGILGLAPETGERVSRIKGRRPDQPYLRLIADPSWRRRFTRASVPPRLLSYWPGPLSLILPVGEGATVALRVPDDPLLRQLLIRLDRALLSTSVNRHGGKPLGRIEEITREFERYVDVVVDGGDRSAATASTIVDLSQRPYRIVREGALVLSPEDLELAQ